MDVCVCVCGRTDYMCVSVHMCARLVQYSLTLVLWILCSLSSLMESLQGQRHFHFFCILFSSLSLLPSLSTCQLITGGQIGIKSFIFHFGGQRWWPAVLMRGTCEPHAVRLWKGLTLPFDSTSAPHKTGKATVWLVDYPSHSQMPSNDYLATSQVRWPGPPPGCTVQSQWRPHKHVL